MNPRLLRETLLNFIREDALTEDVTSRLIPSKSVKAEIILKEEGIISGIEEVKALFNLFNIKIIRSVEDGTVVPNSRRIMLIKGNARDILLVERTALNILSRMSGITTLTKKYLIKARNANPKVKIAATRKTTPGFRYFEKKAVEIAGGDAHRMSLSDMVLIKDNHLRLLHNIRNALKKAKKHATFAHKIEVEVSNKKDALIAARNGADIIMLDNMSPEGIYKTTQAIKKTGAKKVTIEASGGINLENIESYAKTGVDVISIGSLTNSYRSLDMSLEIMK